MLVLLILQMGVTIMLIVHSSNYFQSPDLFPPAGFSLQREQRWRHSWWPFETQQCFWIPARGYTLRPSQEFLASLTLQFPQNITVLASAGEQSMAGMLTGLFEAVCAMVASEFVYMWSNVFTCSYNTFAYLVLCFLKLPELAELQWNLHVKCCWYASSVIHTTLALLNIRCHACSIQTVSSWIYEV